MAGTALKLEKTTRDALLDAADHIVASRGVARLTLEEVAREAGVSKGGLLYHFKSKDALTEAMIGRFKKNVAGGFLQLEGSFCHVLSLPCRELYHPDGTVQAFLSACTKFRQPGA